MVDVARLRQAPAEPKKSVAIVGLGQIGLGYDFSIEKLIWAPQGSRTHLGAVLNSTDFYVKYLVDLVKPPELAMLGLEACFVQWDIFVKLRLNYDLLILASPTSSHLYCLDALCGSHDFSVALIEKPVGESESQACRALELLASHGIQWAVNYHRSYFSNTHQATKFLQQRSGNLVGAEVHGWGELRNIHSHFFHLMGQFVGFEILDSLAWTDGGGVVIGSSGNSFQLRVLGQGSAVKSSQILSLEFEKSVVRVINNGGRIEILDAEDSQLRACFEEPSYLEHPQASVLRDVQKHWGSLPNFHRNGVLEIHRIVTRIESALYFEA